MLVHDLRLDGRSPSFAENLDEVDGSVNLDHALGWIAWYAKSRSGPRQLRGMCHGLYKAQPGGTIQMTSADETWGFGLQFCKQGLDRSNADRTYALKGLVSEMRRYACGPANTRSGLEGDPCSASAPPGRWRE